MGSEPDTRQAYFHLARLHFSLHGSGKPSMRFIRDFHQIKMRKSLNSDEYFQFYVVDKSFSLIHLKGILNLFMFGIICNCHQCPHESASDRSQQNRLNFILRSGTENRASFTVAGMQSDSSSQSPLAISSTGLVKTPDLLN